MVEYDEPSKLMDTNSSFSKLVAEYWSSCRKNSLPNIIRQQQRTMTQCKIKIVNKLKKNGSHMSIFQ